MTHKLVLGLIGGLAALCAAPVLAQCASDADCRGGRVCRDGVCASAPPAACTRDVDCPGDAICESGACVSPAPPPAPVPGPVTVPAPTPAPVPIVLGPVPLTAPVGPSPPANTPQATRLGPVDLGDGGGNVASEGPVVWSTATASLVGMLVPYAAGGEDIAGWGSADLEADGVGGGAQLVGTFALGDVFAMGAFFQVVANTMTTCSPSCLNSDVTDLSLGLAMRLGTGVSDILWLGANLLLGGFYATGDRGLEGGGVAFATHFVLDVILVGGSGFKFGLEGQVGLQVAPWGEGGDSNWDFTDEWLLRPVIALGLVLGA